MPGLSSVELDAAKLRLQHRETPAEREEHVAQLQAQLDAAEDALGALGRHMDVLVLLPSGRVGRLRTPSSALMTTHWCDRPGRWQVAVAWRDGDYLKIGLRNGDLLVGMMVERMVS